jgi:hypothetical protein
LQELSHVVCDLYRELDAELDGLVEGVSEEVASFRPAPEAWSAKETLAHLIAGERWLHGWVIDMIGGNEPWYDDWGGNVPARHAAVLAVYPTVVALLDELKRSEVETEALLAALPPELAAQGELHPFGLSDAQVSGNTHAPAPGADTGGHRGGPGLRASGWKLPPVFALPAIGLFVTGKSVGPIVRD